MKKAEFVRELETRLDGMKQDEIESSVKACTQTIDTMVFTGMNEDEAVAVLGDIDMLASKIRKDKGYPDIQHYSVQPRSSYEENGSQNEKSVYEQQQFYKQQAYYQQQAINRTEDQKKGVIIFLIIMLFLMPFWLPFALILLILFILMYLLPIGILFASAFTGIVGIINITTGSAAYGLLLSGIALASTGFSILIFLAAIKLTALLWKGLCSIFDKIVKNKTERRSAE